MGCLVDQQSPNVQEASLFTVVQTYVAIREAMVLDTEEFEEFTDRCLSIVRRGTLLPQDMGPIQDPMLWLRRLWHREIYLKRRIEETCYQYHWKLTLFDDLLDNIQSQSLPPV